MTVFVLRWFIAVCVQFVFSKFLVHSSLINGVVLKGSSADPPEEFLCPISRELMTEPVVASDGYTYDRRSIETWLKCEGNNDRSPMTNDRLSMKIVFPNHILRSMISDHQVRSLPYPILNFNMPLIMSISTGKGPTR
jgi:hypothetical protein